MSRKDSKGLFANVLGQLESTGERAEGSKTTSPHLMKVAAGVRQIQERSELAERLLRDGGQIFEIDPHEIADSAIPDRFSSAYDRASLTELTASMSEYGQSTPGLVRSLQGAAKPFQIVFGRRRLAAAKILGIKFKAIVRDLNDEDAVILQGEENSNRNDLTFVERCLFAHSQEIAGFGRDVISKSLSTGKSHISEMIRLATALPREMVLEIGPAPGIGRRRWFEFESRWNSCEERRDALRRLLDTIVAEGRSSDERFNALFDALAEDNGSSSANRGSIQLVSRGVMLGELKHGKTGSTITFARSVTPEFVNFVANQIESLHEQFVDLEKR
jgi:ParB family chromosome partitioning protein